AVGGQPGLVGQSIAKEHMHQAKGKSAVGGRARLYVLACRASGERTARIYYYHVGTLALCLAQQRQEVRVGAGGIGPPDKEQGAREHTGGFWCPARAVGRLARRLGRCATDGPLQAARAHAVPEACIADAQVEQAKRATVGVGQNRRTAALGQNIPPSR